MTIHSYDDPMTLTPGRDDLVLRECDGDQCLSIHFASEENMKAYREMEVSRGVSDLGSMSDMWCDEG